MAAKVSTLWFARRPRDVRGLVLDSAATESLATAFHSEPLPPAHPATVADTAALIPGDLLVGVYGDLAFVATTELQTHSPASTDEHWLQTVPAAEVYLLSTDPDAGIGAFAIWVDGKLRRAFAGDPVTILEDVGVPEPFEGPFWAGERPLVYAPGAVADAQDLPFHPQELAEDSFRAWLGFRFTRPFAADDVDPATIPAVLYTHNPPPERPSAPSVEVDGDESGDPAAEAGDAEASDTGEVVGGSPAGDSEAASADAGTPTADAAPIAEPTPADATEPTPSTEEPQRVGSRLARWFGFTPK